MDMNRIEEQARYYQNLPLRDRSVKAVVHLEDAEDELFWNHQLQKASPAAYHFLAYSKNDKGNEAHGCFNPRAFMPPFSPIIGFTEVTTSCF